MKHIKQYLISAVCVVLSVAGLVSCGDDDLSTDQYGNQISVNSFGPCPVMRGGTLKFLGSNLDQITEVRLPGADPITAIDIKQSGNVSEIWIQVPPEKCEPGKVTLVTAKGGQIVTLTPVTYIEGIVLSTFYVGTEGNLNANVGDVVTFKGDYLNLMHEVVFADDARVPEDQFLAHDRYTISVAVPKEARTGKPMLSDTNPDGENLVYADQALTIALPTATGLAPAKLKAGSTLTVSGTALGQIASVKLQGAEVPADDITINADGTQLAFALPATATDGEVQLVTYSGIEIPAGQIETVVPTNLAVAPTPVKNGQDITVTGNDLDLITSLSFGGEAADIKSNDGTHLVATVPEKAQDGDLTLSLANGKSVAVAYTLVKPTVSACMPATLMAGNEVMINGTDLDLVASVAFPGDKEQTVESKDFKAYDANRIALTVPAAAAGTGLKLILKNGTTIEAQGLTIQPATDPALSEAPKMTLGKSATITGKNFNNVEAVYIGQTKVTKITARTDGEMTFVVPESAATGEQQLRFVTPEGKEIAAGTVKVSAAEVDLAAEGIMVTEQQAPVTYPIGFDWGDGNKKFRIMKTGLKALGLVAGKSKLIIYKEAGATGQIQVNDANWGTSVQRTIADWSGTESVLTRVFDDGMIACVNDISDGWSDTAFILQGDLGSGVTKVCVLP